MTALDEHGLFVDRPSAIVTWSGRIIDPLNPDPRDICIEDIAHHLSQTCRFTGAADKFLSVAEHSVRVARLVPDEYKLEAILHDGSEAYIADLPKPVKSAPSFVQYRFAEDDLEYAIKRAFRLPLYAGWPQAVKDADRRMFQIEAKVLCPNGIGQYVDDIDFSLYEEPSGWSPRMAEAYFLDDFAHYWAVRERQKEELL